MQLDLGTIEPDKWNELKSKGYLVIPSFLSQDEIDFFKHDFEEVLKLENHAKYELVDINEKVVQEFRSYEKVNRVMSTANDIGIKADTILGGSYFSTFEGQNYHWHQDQVSYYTCQNHYDYLNFYIPIIKPEKSKSNISVIPFDKAKELDSEWHDKIIGKGAIDYLSKKNKTKVLENDQSGKIVHILNFNLDDQAITPHLNAGDLLIMRGDIVHKTQDSDSKRMAISIRAINSEQLIEYEQLVKGTFSKLIAMAENRSLFKYMLEVFRKMKKDKVAIKTFLTVDFGIELKPSSYFSFFFELLFLRLKLSLRNKN